MRSLIVAGFAGVLGLFGLAAVPATASAHECCRESAYVSEGAIGRRLYAPSLYREAYYPAFTTDYYAYRYVRPAFYPYYNSGYWRPTAELRYRAAYLRPYSPLPRYYSAWGYPKRVTGYVTTRRVRDRVYSAASWRSDAYIVPSYRRYGLYKVSYKGRHHY